jgi:hypothetical protein
MDLPTMDMTTLRLLLYFSNNLFFYHLLSSKVAVNHYVAPLFIWLVINGLLAVYLKVRISNHSCLFRIIPFGYYIVTQRTIKHLILFKHSCIAFISSIYTNVPNRLGLKSLVWKCYSCFILGLLLPTFGHFTKDCGPFFFLISIGFAKAHYELVMNQERQNRTVCCTSTMLIPIKLVGRLMM